MKRIVDDATVESLQVAKWYGVSPEEVEYEWTNRDFLDRQEYMLVSDEVERLAYKRAEERSTAKR